MLMKTAGLVFANVPRTQTVRLALESPSKIFDCADVVARGILRVITALEFFQHHFAKSGHGDSYDPTTYLNQQATTAPSLPRWVVVPAQDAERAQCVPAACAAAIGLHLQ